MYNVGYYAYLFTSFCLGALSTSSLSCWAHDSLLKEGEGWIITIGILLTCRGHTTAIATHTRSSSVFFWRVIFTSFISSSSLREKLYLKMPNFVDLITLQPFPSLVPPSARPVETVPPHLSCIKIHLLQIPVRKSKQTTHLVTVSLASLNSALNLSPSLDNLCQKNTSSWPN